MSSPLPESPAADTVRRSRWRPLMRGCLWVAAGVAVGVMLVRLSRDPLVRGISPSRLDIPSLALAAGAAILAQVLYCSRWHWFLRIVRAPVPWSQAVFTGLVSQLLSAAALGTAGGDVYRGVVSGRGQAGHRVGIVTSILADRVAGLYSLFSTAAIAATFTPGDSRWEAARNASLPVLWGAVLGGGALMLAGLFLDLGPVLGLARRVPAVLRLVAPVLAAVERFRSSPGVFAVGIASGMATHVANAATIWLVARGLGVPHPSLAQHCLIIPLSTCTTHLPLPMAGLGAVELVVDELYRTAVPGAGNAGLLVAFVGRILGLAVVAVLSAALLPVVRRSAGPVTAA